MKKSKSMKKKFKIFFLTNFLKGYFKAFPEKPFFSKKTLFRFYRNFGLNLEISSNLYSQSNKHIKVDRETRSYDFLSKTCEENRMFQKYMKLKKSILLALQIILQMLEMRLDSVVFRLGFAPTIRAARQYVSHGLIKVDGKRVNIPSYNCAQGETITSTSTPVVENCKTFGGTVPSHLSVDTNKTTGTIQRAITRSQIALTVNELLIIEFYSRKG